MFFYNSDGGWLTVALFFIRQILAFIFLYTVPNSETFQINTAQRSTEHWFRKCGESFGGSLRKVVRHFHFPSEHYPKTKSNWWVKVPFWLWVWLRKTVRNIDFENAGEVLRVLQGKWIGIFISTIGFCPSRTLSQCQVELVGKSSILVMNNSLFRLRSGGSL